MYLYRRNLARAKYIMCIDFRPSDIWLGMERHDEHTSFLWADGSTPEWSNWQTNLPDSIEDCVAMEKASGKWYNKKCGDKLELLCEYPKGGEEIISQ